MSATASSSSSTHGTKRIIQTSSTPSAHLLGTACIWFEIDDYAAAAARARELGAQVIEERMNPNAHHHELWLRDPDGYVVVLASPDGTAAS